MARNRSRRITILAIIVAILVAGGATLWRPWEPASQRLASDTNAKPSIAVLPFTNTSGDKSEETFCDGIAEHIIFDLSKISGLAVIARDSSFKYKGSSIDVGAAAQDLGVNYVLQGSVRKEGTELGVAVQLFEARSGKQIWTERYDSKVKDIFRVQNKIASKVASELAVTIKADEQERLFQRHTDNLLAYQSFLSARHISSRSAFAPVRRKFLERAIALDPNFAGGYALQSISYSDKVRRGRSKDPEADLERAFSLARKAIELDDAFPPSHVALAHALLNRHEHDKAVAAVQNAIRLQPSNAIAYSQLAYFLHWSGRGNEAIDALETSKRLNPKPTPHRARRKLAFLAQASFTAQRYEEAILAFNELYEENLIRGGNSLGMFAAAYAATGQDEKARGGDGRVTQNETGSCHFQLPAHWAIPTQRR